MLSEYVAELELKSLLMTALGLFNCNKNKKQRQTTSLNEKCKAQTCTVMKGEVTQKMLLIT